MIIFLAHFHSTIGLEHFSQLVSLHVFCWLSRVPLFLQSQRWVLVFVLSICDFSLQIAWIVLFPMSAVFCALFFLNEKYFIHMWPTKRVWRQSIQLLWIIKLFPQVPLLHLSLFKDRIFVIANIGSMVSSMSMAIILVTTILFLQGTSNSFQGCCMWTDVHSIRPIQKDSLLCWNHDNTTWNWYSVFWYGRW
jgi:hypothetical protein